MSAKATKSAPGTKPIASNRRARRDYDIIDTFECGMMLVGSEVKSLRAGKAQLKDSYARVDDGEVWLLGMHIPPYSHAHGVDGHDPERRRKLLLHRWEIDELVGRTRQDSLTLVPLSLYFKDGRVKLELALARGRKRYDKRHAIAERDANRETERAMASAAKRGGMADTRRRYTGE
jgi:SsrA-binding protein